MPVAIVADSAANIPAELVDRHGISIVPMILKFGDRDLRDGVDLPEGGFYSALVEQKVPVSTSAPSVGDFTQTFERALETAASVVCITVASFVSASYEAAQGAAKEFDGRVRVIDSRSASMGEGFVVLEAARMPADASLEDVALRAEEIARRTSLIATIDTFEFLRRSGRVNVVKAYAATTLNIKPVFGFRAGKLEQMGRPRTRTRALERVAQEVRAAATVGPLHLAVVHADAPEDAAKLRALLHDVKTEEIWESEFTPLMGAHTGPGVVAAAFWA